MTTKCARYLHRVGESAVVLIADHRAIICNREFVDLLRGGRAVDPALEKQINRLEIVGTSMLRRILQPSAYSPQYSAYTGGVAGLVGRLVDLAATLTQLTFESFASNRRRFRELASALARTRNDLMNRKTPGPVEFHPDDESSNVPLLGEMEDTVALIRQAFEGSRSVHECVPSADDLRGPKLLARDVVGILLGLFMRFSRADFHLLGRFATRFR